MPLIREMVCSSGKTTPSTKHSPNDSIMTNFQVINGNNSSESLFAPDDRSKKYEINGFGGDDYIWSHMSDDTVRGGEGNDEILAFDGNDYIEGNQGNYIIYGHQGDDKVYGGQGDG